MLLSIIIPTKNRYNCLIPVLETLLKNIEGDNYEIVVQDNTPDNTPFLAYYNKKTEPRVRYFHIADTLDIVQNTDNAILNSCGKYLIFIGDDDLVSPYVMEIVNLIDKMGLENLTYTPGNYYWEQTKFAKTSYFNAPALMVLNNKISTRLEKRDSQEQIARVLGKGGCYYLGLPRFYHGIASRELLERLKTQFGGKTYFPGPCPDMTISVAMATIMPSYHYMNYPVTVTGVSCNSGAGMGVTNTHVGKIEDQPFLPKETIDLWDKKLPRIWTAFTIYAQSIHQVFDVAGIKDRVDYTVLYAFMRVFEWYTYDYLKPILEVYFKENPEQKRRYRKWVAYLRFRKLVGAPTEWLKAKHAGTYRVTGMKTVDQCMEYLKEHTKPTI